MEERVQRIIARSGLASKRKAEDMIAKGLVTVNGKAIRLGDKADPLKDEILVSGKPLNSEKNRYILLNKPRGYTTTVSDPHEKKLITDLVRVPERLFPVGRLDKDSEGMIILTNDGKFADSIMHPRHEVDKTYFVRLDKPIPNADAARLAEGIFIDERKTFPAKVKRISANEIEITIHEGRKRIIRRMLGALGYDVRDLVRIRIGKLFLGNLAIGKWRELSEEDKKRIFE